jgi:hypothetical protein
MANGLFHFLNDYTLAESVQKMRIFKYAVCFNDGCIEMDVFLGKQVGTIFVMTAS